MSGKSADIIVGISADLEWGGDADLVTRGEYTIMWTILVRLLPIGLATLSIQKVNDIYEIAITTGDDPPRLWSQQLRFEDDIEYTIDMPSWWGNDEVTIVRTLLAWIVNAIQCYELTEMEVSWP